MTRRFLTLMVLLLCVTAAYGSTYIICIGDSITEGFGSNPTTDPCTLMAANLSTFTGVTFTPDNHGEIGTTSAQWLPTAPNYNFANVVTDINSFGASNIPYVLIMLGTNDAQTANRQTAATYAANIEAIVAGLVSHGITKVIINQPPWLGANTGVWDSSSLAYIEGEIAEFPAIQAANPTNTFLGNQTFFYLTQANPNLYMSENDFIHPAGESQDYCPSSCSATTNPGYIELGALWASALESLFYLGNSTSPWQGVLDPWRATDWTQAGIPSYSPNDPPSDSWSQCGATLSSSSSATTIANAVLHTGAGYTGCGSNTYVKLGSGTFSLSGGIEMQGINNNELRGSGPQSTFLVFSGASSCGHGLGNGLVCFDATDSTYAEGNPTGTNITAGLNKGSTSLTVASGSNITANSTVGVIDQCDDGYTGSTCSGTATDSSNYYNCQDAYNPTANSVGSVTITNGTNVSGSGFSASYGSEILMTISGTVTSVPFIYITSTKGALGTSVANGTYTAYFPVGCSFNASVNAARPHRGQEEYIHITACSPTCGTNSSTVLTITPPLIHPNWATGQSPQLWLIQPSQYVGLRDLTIDASSLAYASVTWCAEYYNTSYSWIFDVEFKGCPDTTAYGFQLSSSDWHSNYIYNSGQSSATTDNSAFNLDGGNNLVANNICHNCHLALILNGPASGNVIANNYFVNAYTGNDILFNAIFDGHGNGDDYNLFEGNIVPSMVQDQPHGGHLMETWYRNFMPGWESCANGNCGVATSKTDQLESIMALSFNRYGNMVGNVLGTPALTYTGYVYSGATGYYTSGVQYPWNIGSGNPATTGGGYAGGPIPLDPNVIASMTRFGNWDAYNAATQWNLSEVATNVSLYPNFEPATSCTSALSCPSSFVFSTRPNWWSSSIPFPAIGPDLSSGNIGACTGTINTAGEYAGLPATSSTQCTGTAKTTAWAGHVNAIPAFNCYLNLGGLLDGTGSVLAFSSSCFSGSVPVNVLTGAPLLQGSAWLN